MNKENFIEIGKITKHYGIKGYAKFYYYGDKENFQYKEVFLYKEGELLSYFIEDWYFYKNFIAVKFKNINSINDVNSQIKGKSVYIAKEQLAVLKEDEYYWFQLIGLSVFDTDNNFLGKLKNIIETGSNDVFIIDNNGEEFLIPYIDDVVKNINIETGKMIVDRLEEN